MSTRAGLRPTASVISTPRSTSTNSPCNASRFRSSFRIRTLGSAIFTAAKIRKWCALLPRISQAATARHQVKAWVPEPTLGPANDAGIEWNTHDATA